MDCKRELMDLPMEVILIILDYVNVCDRIAFGATCHRFLDASCDMRFCDKQKLLFYKNKMEQDEPPILDLQRRARPFLHFQFEQVELNEKLHYFWDQVGPSMRSLNILYCELHEKEFIEILRTCNSLEELRIIGCRELLMSGRLLESEKEVNALRNQLHTLRILDLSKNRYLSDALFVRFVSLTTEIRSLVLNGCHISFHNGLYRKFYPSKDVNGPSESVLTFHYIMEFIQSQASSLKNLDFSNTLIDGSALSFLSQSIGLKLETLKLESCEQLTNTGIIALVGHQQYLVELNFSNSTRLTDPSLIAICDNLVHLRKLFIRRCRAITDIGVTALSKLMKLEVLDVSECYPLVTSEGLEAGIFSRYNGSFKELYVSALAISEQQVISIARTMPNITVLDLCACRCAVTDHTIQAIIQHLRWLRVLKMDHCCGISDAGMTGLGTLGTNNMEDSLSKYKEYFMEVKDRQVTMGDYEKPQGYNLSRLRGLRELKLQGSKITDITLEHSFKFNELRKLNLSNCQEITLCGIQYMAKNCPALEKLNLAQCRNITDAVVEIVAKNLPRLKVLLLDNCIQITNEALNFISLNCKALKYLSINGCQSLDPQIMQNMSTDGPYRTIECSRRGSQITPAEYCPLPPLLHSFFRSA